MSTKKVVRWFDAGIVPLSAALLMPAAALAHCDRMDGPVVKAAQKALSEGNVNRVLIWIPAKDEPAIKALFEKTLAVRKLGGDARELAEMHFFETLVRIHRAGEGAGYTGVKAAGQEVDPLLLAADKAIAEGSADALLKLLPESRWPQTRELLKTVLAKRDFQVNDVAAGREYVAAYVAFLHGVERLHGGEEDNACKHVPQGKHTATPSSPQEKIHVSGQTTVRELVGRYPLTRPVFEEHGIDYCCGGGQSLADVAKMHRLELPTLVADLEKALRTPSTPHPVDKDWYAASFQELVNHIIGVHHAYLKKELPRLLTLDERLRKAHAANHGVMLGQAHALLVSLDAELRAHLKQEEEVVFPRILAADKRSREKTSKPESETKSARVLIEELEQEHENAGKILAKLREVTTNYTLPADACPTFKAMYDELQQMEADLHQHIHLENNILFPRAFDLERE